MIGQSCSAPENVIIVTKLLILHFDTVSDFVCKICLDINRFPALATAILLISGEKMSDTIDSSFFYGKQQVTTSVK